MSHSNHNMPVRISIIHGEPITVYGRTLTPVAKIISGGDHQGTIRARQINGSGWAFACVKPSHIIEQRNGETVKIPIPDVTREVLSKIAILSAIVAVVSIVFVLGGYIRRI